MSSTDKNEGKVNSTPLGQSSTGKWDLSGTYKAGDFPTPRTPFQPIVSPTVTPDLEWKDISHERYRVYTFPEGEVRIDNPFKLNVSASGGHRILDKWGESHYIPFKWIHLRWRPVPGASNFEF